MVVSINTNHIINVSLSNQSKIILIKLFIESLKLSVKCNSIDKNDEIVKPSFNVITIMTICLFHTNTCLTNFIIVHYTSKVDKRKK